MINIIEEIDTIKSYYRFDFQVKDKRRCLKNIVNQLEGLIAARGYLPTNYIDNIVGFKTQGYKLTDKKEMGMSYLQIRNYIVRYINKGNHLKRPYNITNKKEIKLKWEN